MSEQNKTQEPRPLAFAIESREQAAMLFGECMVFISVLQETLIECHHHATNGKQDVTIEGIENMIEAIAILPNKLEKIAPILTEEELAAFMAEVPNAPAGNC